MFIASLEKSLERAKRHHSLLALLFLDLDRFKLINDTLGHAAGDRLLQEVATRLTHSVRAEDTVARLGGDEFTVVLEEIAHCDDAAHLCEKILLAIAQPIFIDGREVVTSTSIGISLFPDDALTVQDLTKAADAAMYRAKERGRHTYEFYTAELNALALEHLTLENGLRQALAEGELELHYQPQIELASGTMVGMEALLRWRHPQHGMILPERFIGVAEESGLIRAIGDWVVRAACAQARAWLKQGLKPMRIAINLSGRQIFSERLVNTVKSALQDNALHAEDVELELEVTETVLQSMEQSAGVLKRLRALGVQIAIDDFGTGYSSLGRLKHLPIDTLKIDKIFVRNIPDDKDDKALTVAIITMAHSLGMRVIAEGVETDRQLDFLLQQGCDEVQGFLLGEPVPAEVMAKLLMQQSEQAVMG